MGQLSQISQIYSAEYKQILEKEKLFTNAVWHWVALHTEDSHTIKSDLESGCPRLSFKMRDMAMLLDLSQSGYLHASIFNWVPKFNFLNSRQGIWKSECVAKLVLREKKLFFGGKFIFIIISYFYSHSFYEFI